uniref:Uncharacterized protein n=1 Tax=Mycolicibacterium gilvum (strain PYR-GCK) TaxID=350054 RepID=A4T6J5_MYCGI|nr:hypothetical protein Mflv_1984 [Mycolicibacterium gilvum PYR-GCK]
MGWSRQQRRCARRRAPNHGDGPGRTPAATAPSDERRTCAGYGGWDECGVGLLPAGHARSGRVTGQLAAPAGTRVPRSYNDGGDMVHVVEFDGGETDEYITEELRSAQVGNRWGT